jgi:hypothetical protein
LCIDQLNLFELYNGLLKAHANNKELGLEDAIKHVETKYHDILKQNEQFKLIERPLVEEVEQKQLAHKEEQARLDA